MPDAVKPEICLTGKLLYPVHIGLPAYIQETDGCRRTSAVCAILADTQEASPHQKQQHKDDAVQGQFLHREDAADQLDNRQNHCAEHPHVQQCVQTGQHDR